MNMGNSQFLQVIQSCCEALFIDRSVFC
jgi:hypothetical protein